MTQVSPASFFTDYIGYNILIITFLIIIKVEMYSSGDYRSRMGFLFFSFLLIFSVRPVFAEENYSCSNETLINYTLSQGPFTVENMGSIMSTNTQEHKIMFRLSNGETHLLLYYDVTEIWKYPFEIVDINLAAGAARKVNGVFGRPGPGATLLHSNDKIYIGSGDPGYFMEYNPATGVVRQITKLNQKGAQYTQIGDDGAIYIGECCQGGVERYDPLTDVWENYGQLDPAGGTYQYGYTIGADTRYVYIGFGQSPWYLGVYDRQTGNKTLYFKDENDSVSNVYKAKAGGWYYERVNSAQPWYRKWYKLENGLPTEIPANQVPAVYDYIHRGNINPYPSYLPQDYDYEVDLSDIYPDSGNGNQMTVKWRRVNESAWQSVMVSSFNIQPTNIKRLYSWDGTKMFGFADFYGPVFSYDTSARVATTLGRTQYSNYDVLFDGPNDIYISGYTAATFRYHPNNPWTLNPSTPNINDPSVNPFKIPLAMGKYHYYSAKGADGLIYVASHHERDSTGGEIGWYNPANNSVAGKLRDPFLDYDTRDLKPILNGTKLVYASNNNKFFVFDVATKQIEREITPISGIGGLDKLVEVEPGIIVSAVGTKFYKANVLTGEIIYVKDLPTAAYSSIAMYDHRITLGPDGYVWIYIGNSLYRINPADGSAQKIIDSDGAYTVIFKCTDLYIYGGSNLKRIKNILNASIVNVTNPPSCMDECSLGQKRCSGNYSQTCGNYDADSCLEWNAGTLCQFGCTNGECNPNPCIQGDLNCDGIVDILDLSFIASHFGQTASHPQWNATADVIADGEIDIYDVVFVTGRFG